MAQAPTFNEIDFDYLQSLVGDAKLAVLEIGANNGGDTNRLLDTFPNATVYAFEPDPRAIAKFKNTVTNDRARLFECAIGATDGSATFHMSSGMPDVPPELRGAVDSAYKEDWDQSGSLHAPKKHLEIWPWVRFEQDIVVPVMTLDSFFRQESLTGIDLIWADTQGAEADLIKGGQLALSKTRYLYTEYGAQEYFEGQIGLSQLLASLPDFKVVQQFSTDVLLENQALLPAPAPGMFAGALKKLLRKALFS